MDTRTVYFTTLKMSELKPISHKEFNAYIKGKGFKNKNDYTLSDLKAKFGFKPLVERRKLVISAEDMEPTTFESIKQAARALGVGEMVIRYAREKGRDSIIRRKGEVKVFYLKFLKD